MTYIIIICIIACLASLLTLFSGFGLGTILLPAFGLFFPLEIAIALTAVVHLLNNLFKLLLLGKSANRSVIIRFGLPSMIAAIAGSLLLSKLGHSSPWITYYLGSKMISITPLKVVIGLLLIVFAAYELSPYLRNKSFDQKYLSLGGLLSGFFGGLSGHQGALRSAFLSKLNLTKESFLGTGVVIACMIDLSRLSIYFSSFTQQAITENYFLMALATLSAFIGTYLGNKWMKKITIKSFQYAVAVALVIFGLFLILGIV